MRLEDAIKVRVHEGHLVVSGDMDLASAPVLHKAVAKLGRNAIALDLTGVAFIDSTGLHLLLDLRRAHGRLHLVGSSAAVDRLLAVTGTRDFLFGSDAEGAEQA
jgi:anti-anti-sigma factor